MFTGLAARLKIWTEEGLIGADQAENILVAEKTRKSGKLARDLTHLGVFAILLGIASIVASNWQDIPPFGKLGLHLAVNLGVAAMIVNFDPAEHVYKRDMAVTALFGLFLTFIALIAQIYQLHGALYQTLLFWLGISTPFLWYWGVSYLAILPWLGAALTTLFLTVFNYNANDDSVIWLLLLLSLYLPLLLLSAAKSHILIRRKPDFAAAFANLGVLLPGLSASVATFAFNEGDRLVSHHSLLLASMGFGLIATALLFRPRANDRLSFDLWSYLILSGLLVFLPFALLTIKSAGLAAVLFVLYWLYMAWLGARTHQPRLTEWAIRLIMLRLCILYLEVFGSMLTKGFGMILSGVLLILLIRYASRIVAYGKRMVTLHA